MMLRYAALRADGTVARILTAPDEAAIEMNMPTDATKIAAPAEVRFGTHTYDFAAEAFRPVAQPSTSEEAS